MSLKWGIFKPSFGCEGRGEGYLLTFWLDIAYGRPCSAAFFQLFSRLGNTDHFSFNSVLEKNGT